MTEDVRRGVRRFILREAIGVVMVAVLLFWPAGTWEWPAGWVMVTIYVVWSAATILSVYPLHPELLADRARRRLSTERWDQVILIVFGLAVPIKFIVAGLDFRWGWSGDFPFALQVVGFVLSAGGYALVTWSMVANAFFAMVVEIQEARGQQVATGGPYRLVRHPGYLGSLLFEIGSPLLLASWWALLLGLVSVALFILRTALEDRFLQTRLPGYPEFAARTRYRLLPGIW